jgi:hypothetical protein
MEGHYGKTRYQRLSFLDDILFFGINYLLSFPEHIKRVFHFFLHVNDDHRSTLVDSSLKTVDIPSSCIVDCDLDSSEPYDVQGQSCEPNETKVGLIPPVLNPYLLSSWTDIDLLNCPPILHSFPPKHYKYLPMFDGENLTTEKHIHAFEHFADFFEIEHDDVSMRAFSQSLQGDAKIWFRHLQTESISSWDEMREAFLRFWGERKPWDLLLSEFYAMRRMKDETISMFNRRFFSFIIKFPKISNHLKVLPSYTMQQLSILTCFFFSWRGGLCPCNKCLLMPKKLRIISEPVEKFQIRVEDGGWVENKLRMSMNKKKLI